VAIRTKEDREIDIQAAQLMGISKATKAEQLSDSEMRSLLRRKIEDRLEQKKLAEEFGPLDDLDI
jgi:predicted transcriptional regulator